MLEEVSVGLLSQGTGIFGGLILLDHRENAFTVPVNRASSILAGVLATAVLSVWLGQRGVGARELVGAALVMGAMLVLSVPTLLKARRARAEAGSPTASSSGQGLGEGTCPGAGGYFAASYRCTVSTGQWARATSFCATLPSSRRGRPRRPWVPMMMRSCLPSSASRRTVEAASPTTTLVLEGNAP